MRFLTIWSSIFVCAYSTSKLPRDPCQQRCDMIPGACSEEGSSCIDSICTDLYWMSERTLCSSSIPGCRTRKPVDCWSAQAMVWDQNADGVSVHVYRVREAEEDFSFADPPNPETVRGRKGFKHMEMNRYLRPALQILLQSRSVREAIEADLQSPWPPMDHPVYYNFVTLLRQMYDQTSTEPLDPNPLLSSLVEERRDGHPFDNERDLPWLALFALMNVLSEVSPRIDQVFGIETLVSSSCQECRIRRPFHFLNFPGTDRSYTITDMLRAHLSPQTVQVGCPPGCNIDEDEGNIVQRILLSAPQLVTIGISRQTEDGTLITTSLDQPMEIDLSGIIPGGEEIRYRLVGVVRQIGQGFVADYLDTDRNEWVYTKDTQFHVINGRPRNGGADPCIVFYERI